MNASGQINLYAAVILVSSRKWPWSEKEKVFIPRGIKPGASTYRCEGSVGVDKGVANNDATGERSTFRIVSFPLLVLPPAICGLNSRW